MKKAISFILISAFAISGTDEPINIKQLQYRQMRKKIARELSQEGKNQFFPEYPEPETYHHNYSIDRIKTRSSVCEQILRCLECWSKTKTS